MMVWLQRLGNRHGILWNTASIQQTPLGHLILQRGLFGYKNDGTKWEWFKAGDPPTKTIIL